VTEYAIFGRQRNEIWHKASLGMRMMPERRIHA